MIPDDLAKELWRAREMHERHPHDRALEAKYLDVLSRYRAAERDDIKEKLEAEQLKHAHTRKIARELGRRVARLRQANLRLWDQVRNGLGRKRAKRASSAATGADLFSGVAS